MIYRLIAPDWLMKKQPTTRKVIEGSFTPEQIKAFNQDGMNVYYLPNHPLTPPVGTTVDGTHIDVFNFCYVDCDLKDEVYPSKDAFIERIIDANVPPTRIVDSGNGVHVYWAISDLDAISYLRFQRRLIRLFNTDEAVGQIFQLMRAPGTLNTKKEGAPIICETLFEDTDVRYTSEDFNNLLPTITQSDEQYVQQHFDKTYNTERRNHQVSEEIPPKFGKLLRTNAEAKELWAGNQDDRSKSDYRLGHLMFANGFNRDEAVSVLVNSGKALQRAPVHRVAYAENIVDKIWTYEEEGPESKSSLSMSVRDILKRSGGQLEGTRIPCYRWADDTKGGFRRGQVMGLVAGSGVGKTTVALNLFKGFVYFNPELHHFFVALEQPDREIAGRWQSMCEGDERLYDKFHVVSNYDETGTFRDLSLDQIKEHILDFKRTTGNDIGCVVIDHIGVLCNNNKHGQDEGVKEISKAMKGFAVETDTFLIMQSQTSREKAGIGDLELDKNAAFGTSVFENFVDFLVTIWQPLKRVYVQGAPTTIAMKFCKIRHKSVKEDKIQEDVPYRMFFDSQTQLMRAMTHDEEVSFDFWNSQATNSRKKDKKTDLVSYTSYSSDGGIK